MRRPVAVAFWSGVLGALGLFDYWCARNATDGDSLSEITRSIFRTDTPEGRAAFYGFWSALSLVLLPHICRKIQEAS